MQLDNSPTDILFVDDDRYVLESLRRMLHRMAGAWHMHFFADPQTALTHARNHPCDAVVSDIGMPGMDGFALLDNIRVLHPGAACILLSGDAAEAPHCRERGFFLLTKPCTADALTNTILIALSERQGPAPCTALSNRGGGA
jgi:DNA-binding NtrC family response regulator